MAEMHLRQPTALGKPGVTYSVSEPFMKNKERIQKFKETQDSRYIYQKKWDKAFFELDVKAEIINYF